MPMPPDVDKIELELAGEFPSLKNDPEFLTQCAIVGALLRYGGKSQPLLNAVKALDDRMFALIDSRLKPEAKQNLTEIKRRELTTQTAKGGAFAPKGTEERAQISGTLKGMTTTGEDPFSKVLVSVLEAYERDLGYPANQDHNFHPRHYYVGLVGRESFLDKIATGQHWKDVGASPLHGEYTHRLQWFVVAEASTIPRNKVGEVFRKVGQFREQSQLADGFGQRDLWPRLCDRPSMLLNKGQPGGSESLSDFRSPEHFNEFLISRSNGNALVREFLLARFNKRKGSGGGDNFPSEPSMKEYTARKLHKTAYDQLGMVEKQQVDDLVGQGKANMFSPV